MSYLDPQKQPYAAAVTNPLSSSGPPVQPAPGMAGMGQLNSNIVRDETDLGAIRRRIELGDMDKLGGEEQRQKNRLHRDQGNSRAAWARGLSSDFEDTKKALIPRQHDPNVLRGEAPGIQEAMKTAAEYAHSTQGFTDPEYLSGKAQDKLMALSKEGVDLATASPQLIHMYVTGDELSKAYAMMRLSGVMDENGAMKRLPSVHTQGMK